MKKIILLLVLLTGLSFTSQIPVKKETKVYDRLDYYRLRDMHNRLVLQKKLNQLVSENENK